MALKLSLLLLAIAGIAAIAWWRWNATEHDSLTVVLESHVVTDEQEDESYGLDPTAAGFVLELSGPPSFSDEQLELRGRLQLYVRRGSQYATWRQFPSAIRYEVQDPSGSAAMTEDSSLSISDTTGSYDRYAARPADQVVGQSFAENAFFKLGRLLRTPGHYRIRAHHMGSVSNWVDLEIAP